MREWRTVRVFLLSIGTIVLFILLFLTSAFFRPAIGLNLAIVLLFPIFLIGWVFAACVLAVGRRGRAALFALAFPLCVASCFTFGFSPYSLMLPTVQRVEFEASRASYDAIVANAANTSMPRFVRVAQLDTSTLCCSTQTFEEIWFDESDSLKTLSPSERDKAFWSSHPALLGHTQYSVRALGKHYYFLDIWY